MKTNKLKPYLLGTMALALLVGATSASAHMMGNRPDFENLTEAQQAALDEAHTLRESGELEAARALLEEAGLPAGPMRRGGDGAHEDVRAAIEANDYAAFVAATTEAPFADQVDEAFFAKMVEMHEAMEAGDADTANQIRDELGLPERGPKGPGGMHGFMGELTDEEKAQLEEARALHEAGDHEAAHAIMDSIRDNHATDNQ